MLFIKRRRILVTCSRRLENPAGLRLSPPPSFFLVSGILVMQMRGGGSANPYIRVGEPVARRPAAGRPGLPAPLLGGLGGRPPSCWATGPRDLRAIFSAKFFSEM